MSNARLAAAALSLSAVGFAGIVLKEGYTDTAIIPVPGDVPTVGFGTTEGVKMGDRITPPQAVDRAVKDIQKFEWAVRQCVSVPMNQHEYDAYVSLAYNIGPVNFCNSTLVRKLNQKDYEGACKEILRWNYFKGKPLDGLTKRRQEEYRRCIGE